MSDNSGLSKLPEERRYRRHSTLSGIATVVLSLTGIGLGAYHILGLHVFGLYMEPRFYYTALIFCFMPVFFLSFPHSRSAVHQRIPWFDWGLAVLCLVVSVYFLLHAEDVTYAAWENYAPPLGQVIGLILCLMVLEGTRRAGGRVLLVVCTFFFLYPLFAKYMPLFMYGASADFLRAIRSFVFGTQGLYGVTLRVVGDLLLGFLVFSVVLVRTGGAKFFLQLATALVGRTRGGPAKVAVLASGFFGSMSGSVVANVASTGSVTIPAMKELGYPARYAAAIEAVASTGGVLMPPIMGAAAFLIAQILAVPYGEVILAALFPSLMYYWALLVQVDAYAARTSLTGLSSQDMPSLRDTLKSGWHYLVSLGFLLYGLLYLRWSAPTPYYACVLLIGLAMVQPRNNRLSVRQLPELIRSAGHLIGEILALLLGIGFILGALSLTGVAYSFAHDVVVLTRGSVALLLGFGFLTSLVLGMGLTITACYVFLAVTMVPPLVAAGLHPMGCHLFVMYAGMVSYITPPVALAAMTAAGIAGSDPMRTGLLSMRLGASIFFLPFFFVLSPTLLLDGPLHLVLIDGATMALGILLVASSMEKYLVGVGVLATRDRVLLALTGILIATPFPLPTLVGMAALGAMVLLWRMTKRPRHTYEES